MPLRLCVARSSLGNSLLAPVAHLHAGRAHVREIVRGPFPDAGANRSAREDCGLPPPPDLLRLIPKHQSARQNQVQAEKRAWECVSRAASAAVVRKGLSV